MSSEENVVPIGGHTTAARTTASNFESRIADVIARRSIHRRKPISRPLAIGMTGFWLAAAIAPEAPGHGLSSQAGFAMIVGTVCAGLLVLKRYVTVL